LYARLEKDRHTPIMKYNNHILNGPPPIISGNGFVIETLVKYRRLIIVIGIERYKTVFRYFFRIGSSR
jgi:hypothetical protein